MSFSPIPGAIVPGSGGWWGPWRAGRATSGACATWRPPPAGGAGAGGGAEAVRGVSALARGGAGGGGGGVGTRPRRWAIFASMVCLIFAYWSLICLHPEVATITSAHIHGVLRRMSSLHRKKDTGAVLAAQGRGVAALRVRHDPHHVAAGVVHAGDVVGRAVRIVTHVAPYHPLRRLELGGRRRVHHIAPVPVSDRDLQYFASFVQAGERRAGLLDPHPRRARQEPQAGVPHQPAREQPRLAQDLKPVADAEHGAAGARMVGHRRHDRGKPRDGTRAEVVAVAEPSREDHDVGSLQGGVLVPDEIGV